MKCLRLEFIYLASLFGEPDDRNRLKINLSIMTVDNKARF